MGEPNARVTLGSPWCPCGKHKAKEQVVCLTCFASLPMIVKYGLGSRRAEILEKSITFAIRSAVQNGELKPKSFEGELFG